MTTVHALSRRSIDQLEDAIIDHSKRLNATEYEFLELVREFDIRQGWKAYYFNSCAEWLNLKCGIVVGTARKVELGPLTIHLLPGDTGTGTEPVLPRLKRMTEARGG